MKLRLILQALFFFSGALVFAGGPEKSIDDIIKEIKESRYTPKPTTEAWLAHVAMVSRIEKEGTEAQKKISMIIFLPKAASCPKQTLILPLEASSKVLNQIQ